MNTVFREDVVMCQQRREDSVMNQQRRCQQLTNKNFGSTDKVGDGHNACRRFLTCLASQNGLLCNSASVELATQMFSL